MVTEHERLSEQFEQEIHSLLKLGIIEQVQPDKMHHLKTGDIFVPCADADRILDTLEQHCHYHKQHREAPRPHLLSLNGGALRIPWDYLRGGLTLITDISDTLKQVKPDMYHVSLYGHTPCSKYPIKPSETIHGLILAKEELKEHLRVINIDGITIQCFYHVDRGTAFIDDDRFRTYRVNAKKSIVLVSMVRSNKRIPTSA